MYIIISKLINKNVVLYPSDMFSRKKSLDSSSKSDIYIYFKQIFLSLQTASNWEAHRLEKTQKNIFLMALLLRGVGVKALPARKKKYFFYAI